MDLFLAALERPSPAARSAFLDDVCANDPALRQRLDSLLRAHDCSDPVLDRPAAEHLSGVKEAHALDFLKPSNAKGSLGRLGHYEVLETVGRGGMGIVLRALDEKLHRVVALKVLDPTMASHGEARQRFVREARAAAAVSHDHVIGIFAVEDADRVPYIAMQFVAGKTLQEKLDRSGPLALPEILRIGLQIAEGLSAAHRQGLIHRDIKPANILLENGVERVRITDFGLARAVDDASLTQSGVVAGTPAFMSPEQAAAEHVDHRSDLFSLGSVLYAMCAGHPPFRAKSVVAVLRKVCDEEPRPLREVNPAIPDWLEAIVARLQAKKPADRLASAEEVATLLSRHLARLQAGGPATDADRPVVVPPRHQPTPPRRPRRVGRLVVAGVVVTALLAAGGWLIRNQWHRAEEAGPQTNGQPEIAGQPKASTWQPAPPPTAEELAKLVDPVDKWHGTAKPPWLPIADNTNELPQELIALAGCGPFQLPRVAVTHWPILSTDGKLLALPCGNATVLYDAHTGAVLRELTGLKDNDRAFRGDFSADGKRFACGSTGGEIRVWNVASGKEETSIKNADEGVYTTLFVPGGEQLATCGTGGEVRLWNASTGQAGPSLGKHQGVAMHMAFSPDRARLASAGSDMLVKVWDWKENKLVKTLDGHKDSVDRVAFSPDGTLLAAGSQTQVLIWDTANWNLLHTLPIPGSSLLEFTPDGQTLVTARHKTPLGVKRSYVRYDLKTKTQSNIDLPGTGGVVVGAMSSDGTTLYAMSCESSESRLIAFDADSGKERFAAQGHEGAVFGVAFSPDGRWMASGGQDGLVCLWDLNRPPTEGFVTPARRLSGHEAPIWSVAFRPDGRLIASGSFDETIRLWDVTNGREPRVLHGHSPLPAQIAFCPDGETVAGGGIDGIVNQWDVKTGLPVEPLNRHGGPVGAVAFSPDGHWFASGDIDRTVLFVDRTTPGKRQPAFRGTAPISALAFSPDSQTLAAVSEANGLSVKLLNVATRQGPNLVGHTRHVQGIAFHPAGDRVATRSYDGTVRLWDTATGAASGPKFDIGHVGPAGVLIAPTGRQFQIGLPNGVAFTPSGRHFAAGLANGTIAIFATPAATR